jgi:3-dehydroquinate synthase
MIKTVTVNASKKYDILIGHGLIDGAGGRTKELFQASSAAVVTDDIVNGLYGERLASSLLAAGCRVIRFVIKNGEASKSVENYIALLNFLAEAHFTRSDAVFALGGGVVGDLAGFAASTYMRGMRLVQLPTTLLAAVDSSVGGKTGIDLEAGKNLAGTFYQPDLVLCDTSALDTLPCDVFQDGLAEVVKYGVIADAVLIEILRKPMRSMLEEIIARCVGIKKRVVEADEKEAGPRKLLNLGHTVGHAVEALSGYAVSHGKAVAIGMAVVVRSCMHQGICSPAVCNEIVGLIKSCGLPTETDFNAAQLAEAALSDKKRSGGAITLVLPKTLGLAELEDIGTEELEHFIGLGL